jgi:flagellar hook-length control protein FliK
MESQVPQEVVSSQDTNGLSTLTQQPAQSTEQATDTEVLPAQKETTEETSEAAVVVTKETVTPKETSLRSQSVEGQSEESKTESLSLTSLTMEDDVASQSFDTGAEESDSQEQGFFQSTTVTSDTEPLFEQPVTTVTDFVQNMVEAVNTEQSPETVNMQQMVDIVNQVVEQIHSTMEDGATTLEMQLNPESLGKLLLSVTNKSGVMTASFTVQTAEAKAALESQMITLRENLEQKNLKVEAVEVSVSDFAFSQSGQADGDQKEFQQGNGRRARFRYDDDEEESETGEDVQIQADRARRSVMRDLGSSIDFTA